MVRRAILQHTMLPKTNPLGTKIKSVFLFLSIHLTMGALISGGTLKRRREMNCKNSRLSEAVSGIAA
ncbi:hypothetical protein [Fowl aviadenovirus C]|nr:hypothetical protein [Fowl aviadenovirus C]